jgi:hypothetical protein
LFSASWLESLHRFEGHHIEPFCAGHVVVELQGAPGDVSFYLSNFGNSSLANTPLGEQSGSDHVFPFIRVYLFV